MPVLLAETPVAASTDATVESRRKRWTRAECAAMESVGLDLTRYELVEGDLISQVGKKRPHVNSAVLLHEWLLSVFGLRRVVAEGPIDVSPQDNPTNEPQPDLVVLKRDISSFSDCNPGPEDIHLAVEIADSTLSFDLRTKCELYARAGLQEYWVLDIRARRLIVHRDPIDGGYNCVAAYNDGESVAPIAAPQQEFRVADAFVTASAL